MDAESSDSDVSRANDDDYRIANGTLISVPSPLPPPSSKQALESSDAVQARLKELERVENHNVRKHEMLKEKRARKDMKIARRREAQDRKWQTILDARQKRDERIQARRKREDSAFNKFFLDMEGEEDVSLAFRPFQRITN